MNKASCLSLLSNAAVLWNMVQMARITQQLRDAGNEIADEDLAHVWPLQRTRIIPNGTLLSQLAAGRTSHGVRPVTALNVNFRTDAAVGPVRA